MAGIENGIGGGNKYRKLRAKLRKQLHWLQLAAAEAAAAAEAQAAAEAEAETTQKQEQEEQHKTQIISRFGHA